MLRNLIKSQRHFSTSASACAKKIKGDTTLVQLKSTVSDFTKQGKMKVSVMMIDTEGVKIFVS